MKLIETKGDVKFFEDEKGKQYQQIGEGEIFKVKDGNITHKQIKQLNGCRIKYNTNGVYGFSVWINNRCMEDRMWTLAEAEEVTKEINRQVNYVAE